MVEKALNHTIGRVRGVYNRTEYAPQRREMLQFWADQPGSFLRNGAGVISIDEGKRK